MKTNITKLSLSIMTTLTLGITSIQAQNLIKNGSFEEMDSVTKNSSKWKTGTLINWSGDVKLLTNKAGKKATDGNRKLVLDKSKETKVDMLSQEVIFEVDGNYKISLDAYGLNTDSSHLQVLLDGKIFKRIEPTKVWANYVAEFSTTAGTHTLGFKEIKTQNNGKGAILDNVVLEKVVDSSTTPENNNSNTNSSTDATLMELTQGEELSYQVESSSDKKSFSLVNAPEGMSINPRTGVISWKPLRVMKDIQVQVKRAKEEILKFTFSVKEANFDIDPNWIFIAPNGSNSNSGKYNAPLADLSDLCGKNGATLTDKEIFFRGGLYTNPDFGGADYNVSHKSFPAIRCSGIASKPLTIKPWSGEKAKIKFDSAYGIQISANHVRFEGFEIEGIAQDIKYKDVVERWWNTSSYYNGQGINIEGYNIEVKNNVIHDIPGAGINTKGNAIVDNVVIDNNIIFNCSWWSTGGTTALGIVGANKSSHSNLLVSKKGIDISNNLIFGSESRIFSHVFSKGFSHLIIDEGSSMLLKRDKGSKIGTYNKGFMVKNNYFLFNGKGVSLRWDKIELQNNTFYNNGTTLKGTGGGIRSAQGTNMVIENNAIYTDINANLNAIDFHNTEVSIKSCKNNRYYTLDTQKSLKNPLACKLDEELGNKIDEDMFQDAQNNDFVVSADTSIGASESKMENHKKVMKELGYEIKPTNYTLEIDGMDYKVESDVYYETQIDDILESVTKGTGYKEYEGPANFTLKGKKLYGYKITFENAKNHTGKRVYYLEIEE